jgi:hypothetical protein
MTLSKYRPPQLLVRWFGHDVLHLRNATYGNTRPFLVGFLAFLVGFHGLSHALFACVGHGSFSLETLVQSQY